MTYFVNSVKFEQPFDLTKNQMKLMSLTQKIHIILTTFLELSVKQKS